MQITTKDFWQHVNGKIYVIESDTFGKVIGGVGPLDANNLRKLEDYVCKNAITDWAQYAIAHHKMRLFNHPAKTASNPKRI
jgi:hypothetical protein